MKELTLLMKWFFISSKECLLMREPGQRIQPGLETLFPARYALYFTISFGLGLYLKLEALRVAWY